MNYVLDLLTNKRYARTIRFRYCCALDDLARRWISRHFALSDFRYTPEVKTLTLQIKPSLIDLALVERGMKRQSVVIRRDNTSPWVAK
jgi:hypothetical protein